MPTNTSTQPARSAIAQLIKLNIDLIPIRPGGKVPLRPAWNVPVARTINAVMSSFGGNDTRPIQDFVRDVANIGMLNETSKIVTLDCDSPLAGKALQAACKALGGDFATLYPETSWTSVKGQKAMYRRPAAMQAGRTVFRVWKEGGTYDVIFELRGTGQDVLPPSYRADADVHLAWFHDVPTKVPPMPKWLVRLDAELAAGKGPAIDAMCAALELTPEQLSRTKSTTHNMRGYPPRMMAYVAERGFVNSHFTVPALLEQYGYRKDGKRWKPADSSHAAGIVGPRNANENWICEHEGDALAGVFDAWRIIVEHEFAGDAGAAAEAVRIDMKRSITSKPVGNNQNQQQDKGGAHASVQIEPVVDVDVIDQEPEVQAARESRKNEKRAEPVVQVERDRDDRGERKHDKQKKPKHGALHKDFLTQKNEKIKPIIKGLIQLPPGMHILSAMPKAGKSTLTTAFVLTATTGRSLSGATVDKPVGALYCAFDESVTQNLQPRMGLLAQARNLPCELVYENLQVIAQPDEFMEWALAEDVDTQEPLPFEWMPDDSMSEDQIEARSKLLRAKFNPYTRALYHFIERHGIRFAVIDVIGKLRMKSTMGQNAYDRDLEEYSALNAIGLATHCAIIGVHHMNKAAAGTLADNQAQSLGKVSGTNAIAGAVQSIISMSRIQDKSLDQETLYEIEPKGHKILIDHIARDSKGLPMSAFSLVATYLEGEDEPAMEWHYMGPADVLAGDDEKRFICEWLYDQPPQDYQPALAILTAAITQGVVTSRGADSVRKLLQRMGKRGTLESLRGANGGFRLTPETRAQVKAAREAKGF